MIELEEDLVALSSVSNLLPRRRGGRKVHVSTLYRWSTSGCRGVVLETIQVGGTRCTSREALARFFRQMTEDSGLPTAATESRSPEARQRGAKEAEQQLRQLGI